MRSPSQPYRYGSGFELGQFPFPYDPANPPVLPGEIPPEWYPGAPTTPTQPGQPVPPELPQPTPGGQTPTLPTLPQQQQETKTDWLPIAIVAAAVVVGGALFMRR